MAKRISKIEKGLTFVELMVALMVSSIVLGAVAAIAYAMSTADAVTSDVTEKQAQLRYATIRISSLIKHCKLVCGDCDDSLALWQADNNDPGKINPGELVYIEAGPDRKFIKLLAFTPSASQEANQILMSDIRSGTAKTWLIANCAGNYTVLVPDCNNVLFNLDVAPPYTHLVGILFDVLEDRKVRTYQINAGLRCRAINLLDSGGNIVSGDDD